MSIKDEYPKIIKQRIKDNGLDDTNDYLENSPTIKAEIELFFLEIFKKPLISLTTIVQKINCLGYLKFLREFPHKKRRIIKSGES